MSWERIKHAFAVDEPGRAEPSPTQAEAVDAVCRQIVKRHLTTPAIAFLEMARPLNYVGAQTLHFFAPFLAVLTSRRHKDFALFLEQRSSVDYICRRIEELEEEAVRREQNPCGDERRSEAR